MAFRSAAAKRAGARRRRMDRAALVRSIIQKEWDFFQQTRNRGGRASCQDQPGTFAVMRGSQFAVWPDEALGSYAADLTAAEEEGRNPVTEKYARMMASTHPEEYEAIRDLLPPLSARSLALIEEITAIHLDWEADCDRLFPHVRATGRPLRSAEDSPLATSFETYLRGELATCSETTLEILARHAREARARGRNLARETLDHQARGCGFASVEALEESRARRARRKDL